MRVDKFPSLVCKLDEMVAITEHGAKVVNIVKAEAKVVDGIRYHILANILSNGNQRQCCFTTYENFDGPFLQQCSDCDGCKCFGPDQSLMLLRIDSELS